MKIHEKPRRRKKLWKASIEKTQNMWWIWNSCKSKLEIVNPKVWQLRPNQNMHERVCCIITI